MRPHFTLFFFSKGLLPSRPGEDVKRLSFLNRVVFLEEGGSFPYDAEERVAPLLIERVGFLSPFLSLRSLEQDAEDALFSLYGQRGMDPCFPRELQARGPPSLPPRGLRPGNDRLALSPPSQESQQRFPNRFHSANGFMVFLFSFPYGLTVTLPACKRDEGGGVVRAFPLTFIEIGERFHLLRNSAKGVPNFFLE